VLRATGRLGFGAIVNLSAYYCIGKPWFSIIQIKEHNKRLRLGIPLGLYLAFWRGMELKGLWTGITAALFYAASVSVYVVLRMDWGKEVENAKARLERSSERSDGDIDP
jgi:MATE family multidrug resistance protein